MWLQSLPVWCVVASCFISCACVAAEFMRMRKSWQELALLQQEFALKQQEHENVVARLESQLADSSGKFERASSERAELTRTNQQLAAAVETRTLELQFAREDSGLRQAELDRALAQARDLAARNQGQDRSVQLEAQLSSSNESLRQRAQAIESLQKEVLAKQQQLDAGALRLGQFEQQVQQAAERERERLLREQETESARSARVGELEAQLASSNEALSQRGATVEALQSELIAKQRQIEAAAEGYAQIEKQLQQSAGQELERLHREQELERTRSAGTSELEAQLASSNAALSRRATAIEALQGEVAAKQQQVLAAELDKVQLERELQQIAEHEREQILQEDALERARAARTSELEAQLASSNELLSQKVSAIGAIQSEVQAKHQLIETLTARSAQLEQQLQQVASELRERLRREQELERALSVHTSELEAQLASGNEALDQRATIIEALHDEVLAKQLLIETTTERCAQLEQQALQRAEQDRQRLLNDQELESARSARANELEMQLASNNAALTQRALALESLQAEVLAKQHVIEAAAARCTQAEQQLQQDAQLERERARQALESENARHARTSELEQQLASREEHFQQLRDECTQLTDRCKTLSDLVELRTRDLRHQEQRLLEVASRVQGFDSEVLRGRQELAASEALNVEMLDGRISALFKRRSAQGADPLPEQYLAGLEQGDFELALAGLLGEVEPLSAAALARLGHRWRDEHAVSMHEPLGRQVVYLWADGLHLKLGLEEENAALLVVVASFGDGSRSVIAAQAGDPASKAAWLAVLQTLVERGMNVPRMVVADEVLGLWDALDELGWDCARQHCWKHKIAGVMALLPKNRHAEAGEMLRAISGAETRAVAIKLRDKFVKRCGIRCAPAGKRLCADWKHLISVYAFPKDHWSHLRTTAVIEAPFASIRLCANESKAHEPVANAEAILWKLLSIAGRAFRRLSSPQLLPSIAGRANSAADNPGDESPTRAA